jgi:hypothetical protein
MQRSPNAPFRSLSVLEILRYISRSQPYKQYHIYPTLWAHIPSQLPSSTLSFLLPPSPSQVPFVPQRWSHCHSLRGSASCFSWHRSLLPTTTPPATGGHTSACPKPRKTVTDASREDARKSVRFIKLLIKGSHPPSTLAWSSHSWSECPGKNSWKVWRPGLGTEPGV